ncbi:hypothetical protein [Paenibacillus sp. 1001270B_150601_E10]|uniref:hypothetical protein n=1 Tax=Paenibacillus sp. 1001270B_150601_E10 TaxID=2787079 RepID=UPI0018A076FB|nr:hypothetical protein [Paenibacillus sp. 1001270B_150601_E10]
MMRWHRVGRVFTAIEGIVLFILTLYAAYIFCLGGVGPYLEDLQSDDEYGTYIDVHSDTIAYYGKKFQIKGAAVADDHFTVFVRSAGVQWQPNLPFSLNVRTDQGEVLQSTTRGQNSGLFYTRGSFTFKGLPSDTKEVVVYQQSYGESFSFRIPLGGDE